MNIFRKMLSLILVLVLLVSMAPPVTVEALGAKPDQPASGYHRIDWRSNPLYPNTPARELPRNRAHLTPDSTDYADYLNLDEAAAVMRQEMIGRKEEIHLDFYLDRTDPRTDAGDYLDVLLDVSFEHTGDPREGDYLMLHYAGSGIESYYHISGNLEYYSAIVYVGYYTTAEQEQEVDLAVDTLLTELALDGCSDYEKVETVYDYMAENIRYDYDHLYDWEYELQYTAYAALINRTAVCQGYANLLYRLLLELGVECRSIVSIEQECHAWNIVRLGDLYYNCDVTWDEGVPKEYRSYFLKGNVFFQDHTPDDPYRTPEFLQAHPMSETDYDPQNAPVHTHSYSGITYAPTCMEEGYTEWVCSCGDSYVSDPVSPLGHDWDDGVVTREPTEDAVGVMTYTCLRCGETDFNHIPKLDHTHKYESIVTAPTCTQQGFTTWICDCGDSYNSDVTEPLGHDWDEGVVTREPTEDAVGVMTYTCLRCGETDFNHIPKLDHTHKYESIVTAPTCTQQGFTTWICECGDSYNSDVTEPLGHDWDEGVVTREPTEDAVGVMTYTCRRCGETDFNHIPKLDHTHKYESIVTAPTCTQQGFTTWICECGESYNSDVTEPLGHDWDEGVVTRAPTEDAVGVMTYTCRRCGETDFNHIPKLDHTHKYESTVTAPTCTEDGYTVYVCDCGDSYVSDSVSALGHNWDAGTVISQPAVDQPGTICYTCLRCGAYRLEDIFLPECPFTDVANNAYFYEPVLWAVSNSITSGVSATEFAPNWDCTRGQVVTFLWRAAGCPEPSATDNPFTDVSKDQYYYKPILWAVENGITQGVGGGLFAPDRQVTRGQFVTFLWRAAGQPAPAEQAEFFLDVAQGVYYCSAVLWAAENGITSGTGGGNFSPDVSCTRAQVVTFLYRNSKLAPEDPVLPDASGHEAWGAVRSPLWQDRRDADLTTLPQYDSLPSFEAALEVLDALNPDGALIARLEEGSFMVWYDAGDGLSGSMDTAIHESYHGVSHSAWDHLTTYLEDGWLLAVPETATYRSEEMTVLIPEEYRTFRFEGYVAPGAIPSANQNGIYGLMNEFNAYQTGMNHYASMFDYYCAQPQSFAVWKEFINGCENNVMAYAEFRYYILTYLIYAENYYPDIFAELMYNTALRYAFTVVDANFRKDIAQYLADLERLSKNEIPGLLSITIDHDYVWHDGTGFMRFLSDYEMLMEVMEFPEYVEIYEAFLISE